MGLQTRLFIFCILLEDRFMQGSSYRWTLLVSLNVLAWGVLVFSGKIGAVPPNPQPFANAVEQNMEIIRELKEIKTLLQDQNTLLRTNAVRKVENAAPAPKNGAR